MVFVSKQCNHPRLSHPSYFFFQKLYISSPHIRCFYESRCLSAVPLKTRHSTKVRIFGIGPFWIAAAFKIATAHWHILTTRPTTLWKQCKPFERWTLIGKYINTVYRTSVTKDSTVAAKASVKYKLAFRSAQWTFSIDQCISFFSFGYLYSRA